jgi:hypothetical protein
MMEQLQMIVEHHYQYHVVVNFLIDELIIYNKVFIIEP